MFADHNLTYFADTCMNLAADKICEEHHRYYHTMDHLDRMMKRFATHWNVDRMDPKLARSYVAAIAFHDVVYDPTRKDNEERSAEYMREKLDPNIVFDDCPWDLDTAERLILSTKTLKDTGDEQEMAFQRLDCDLILNGSMVELIAYEDQIFREYQFVPHDVYRVERKKVLDRLREIWPQLEQKIEFLKCYVDAKRPRVGLYVGSFNPFHVGHMDISIKTANLFDKVVIVQCVNPAKPTSDSSIMDLEDLRFFERSVMTSSIREIVDHYRKQYDVSIVRGLRNGLDLTYEFDYMRWLKDFKVFNPVVCIPADPKLAHVSSSSIRGLMSVDKTVAGGYIVK